MSPLFLIAALLTADPQPEKIESIVFLGTPEYAAKVRTFKLDLEQAKLRLFLNGCDKPDFTLHCAIINDHFLFVDERRSPLLLDGTGVHGVTGHVRSVAFRKDGSESRELEMADAESLGCRGSVVMEGDLDEAIFWTPWARYGIVAVAFPMIMEQSWANDAKDSTEEHLILLILRGVGARRRIACEELATRGASAIPEMLELVSNDRRDLRLCGLFCLSTVKSDISTTIPQVIQALRRTATEEIPIGTLSFVGIANQCAEQISPPLKELAQNHAATSQERAYALEVLARIHEQELAPFLFEIAADNKSDPIVARAASRGLGRLRAKDELVRLLRTKNKIARIWACYCLGTSALREEPIIAVLRKIAQEDDAEIREAANAAIAVMNNRRP